MSKKIWKKIEKSNLFTRLKLKLRQLIGTEPIFKIDLELSMSKQSGWSFFAPLINEKSIVYSMGICDDTGFEEDIINLFGANVYAFDPTPHCLEWIKRHKLPEKFIFYPWAAAGKDGNIYLYPRLSSKGKKSKVMFTLLSEKTDDGIEVTALTTSSMAKKLGHSHIDVLKMDIEGAEYDVIKSLISESSIRPNMILVEFHHRFKGLSKQDTKDAVYQLRQEGYKITDISITGREMCFVYSPSDKNL